MTLTEHFRALAQYNRIANERLFEACGRLDETEYRKRRDGSFGSIHGLLNHILVGDRRWLGLFENGERATPRLDQILYDQFAELRGARAAEDARIETFFACLDGSFWTRSFAYINNQGKEYVETAHVACSHLFNHQTHHRGQAHVMLSEAGIAPPSLDMHRILNP